MKYAVITSEFFKDQSTVYIAYSKDEIKFISKLLNEPVIPIAYDKYIEMLGDVEKC